MSSDTQQRPGKAAQDDKVEVAQDDKVGATVVTARDAAGGRPRHVATRRASARLGR